VNECGIGLSADLREEMPEMATEADYDHIPQMSIDPSALHDTATTMKDIAQEIGDAVDRIMDTLDALVLDSWKGETEKEVNEFADHWSTVMDQLFGSKDKPDDGVLNAMVDGVTNACNNYNEAESGLTNVWNDFAAKLPSANGSSGDESKAAPPDKLDVTGTAITADYPPYGKS
jgi:hypothetical protein